MEREFYVKLQNPIKIDNDTTLDELRVDVAHRKREYNALYGQYEESGVKIYFKPVQREKGRETSMVSDSMAAAGFKILALNAERKSQKKIDMVANAIKPLLDTFGEIWGNTDFNHTICNLVIDAMMNIPK